MNESDPFRTFKSLFHLAARIAKSLEERGRQSEVRWSGRIENLETRLLKPLGWLNDRPLLGFLLFFALVASRSFFWLIDPQFYIEDGPEFYAPAHNLGISTLPRIYQSYYHAAPRILSLIADSFPVRYGPLAMEILALAVQAFAATVLTSKRLERQIPSLATRYFLGFLVIGFPYSNELFGNIAHSQWYLPLVTVGLIWAVPPKNALPRIGEYLLVAVNCLTGPFSPVIALVSWSGWRGDRSRRFFALIATACAAVTMYAILTHPRSGIAHNARFSLVERMIANQVFWGPIFGFHFARNIEYNPFFDIRDFLIAAFGVYVIATGVARSSNLIKSIAALGVFSSITSLDSKASWVILGAVGVGERYFFFLGITFVFCLHVLSRAARLSLVRWGYRLLLVCFGFATVVNWIYDPPFRKFDYAPQVAGYDRVRPGEKIEIEIPIDRKTDTASWKFSLDKK